MRMPHVTVKIKEVGLREIANGVRATKDLAAGKIAISDASDAVIAEIDPGRGFVLARGLGRRAELQKGRRYTAAPGRPSNPLCARANSKI